MRDFTMLAYENLCKSINNSKYDIYTVKSYLQKRPIKNAIIIRHDIERLLDDAYNIASIEREYDIRSTYYIRMKRDVFKPEILKKISSFGHEIGYHYEVLDKAKGDIDKAIEIFESELNEFRNIYLVETISMHGNPLTKWINQDIWTNHQFEKFGVIGDGFLSIDFSNILYITDTGRKWNSTWYNIKDYPPNYDYKKNPQIKSSSDIAKIIEKENYPIIYLNVHPDIWADNEINWWLKTTWQNIKNLGKIWIKWYRGFS